MMTLTDLTRQINRLINKALGGGLAATDIATTLEDQATALGAVTPLPTHDRTIEDPGPALNPSQP